MLHKLKAMVVDDSRVMRNMVMEALKKSQLAEFEFLEAEDGQDALNKLAANPVHIAFVDWNMPNMTGIEFIKAARATAKTAKEVPIPMVMVTSEKTMGKIEEAMDQAGADGFIIKPFTAEEMAKRLVKVVERAAQLQIRKAREAAAGGNAVDGAMPRIY